mmetsp:Transcript_37963/g.60128  ORF Transcript_37963/g.60128 Transcript_37963/m.60128 type:complete len:106 (+) Transcript_37963:81-398(+)|eukprot:CAMPEP_0169162756 /NCGR_PEP_ID=MMETSP1015-20121227/57845_1 /TAXON_ID=342587 /ORGANISM="Karlodinium micrum, Strain CCMP2283" /LENGTH=105 /DNA_ID=CAMNT_0009234895 /DNA_START=72 /DNA_END=389 /DNA_ORIENTATION=+
MGAQDSKPAISATKLNAAMESYGQRRSTSKESVGYVPGVKRTGNSENDLQTVTQGTQVATPTSSPSSIATGGSPSERNVSSSITSLNYVPGARKSSKDASDIAKH